jgi:hypothetical protein
VSEPRLSDLGDDLQLPVPPAAFPSNMYVSCAAEAKRHRVIAPVPLRGKAWAESIYFLLVLDEAAGSSLQAVVLGSACTRLFHSHLHVDFGSGSDCLTIFIYHDYT